MSDSCRSCGAPVRWVLTRRDKRMPLDPEPVADGNVLIDDTGRAVVTNAPPLGAVLYRSHFTTCPEADEWRTR